MLYNVLGQVHVPDNDSDDDLRAKEDVKVGSSPLTTVRVIVRDNSTSSYYPKPRMRVSN